MEIRNAKFEIRNELRVILFVLLECFMKRLVALILILIVVGLGGMFLKECKKEEGMPIAKNISQQEKEVTEKIANPQNEKIFAVWLTYSEIGSLVKGKSEEEYKENIEKVLKDLKENKINTVFYQCRAFCDSFYKSDIFPVSKYINTEGENLNYDPFEIFLEKAKIYGISVHCWVNPYRISYDSEIKKLSENSPAKKLYKENKSSLIICDSGIFLNPAHPESRKLVLDGIREILNKYQVSGIHFDDYFYPEVKAINDKKLYEEYKNQGGELSLEDWRRENVNALISSVYSLVKGADDNLLFSVSPSADIEKCRNVFYCDVEKWCREEGFADFLIPQIYYGFENESMPFYDVMKEWENVACESDVPLICGLGAYKCGKTDSFAGKGENEWEENVNILSRQYEQMLKSPVWQGFSLFSYSYCFGENANEISKKEIKKLLYMVE